ncbi:MAG TPA: APC family permease [Chloroflexia bacterium]|nr:APC family permease [Chloroflexia bacterium]
MENEKPGQDRPKLPEGQSLNGARRQSFKVERPDIKEQAMADSQPKLEPAGVTNAKELKQVEEPTKLHPGGLKEHAIRGRRPGDRYIRLTKPSISPDQIWEGSNLHVKVDSSSPITGLGRSFQRVKRILIGRPIPTAHSVHERLTKTKALAIYSSDALSSVAYATEQILIVLVLAGSGALNISIPISIAIALLLVIVGTSYRQTIYAYPKGGGSYIVAKDNLGITFGLIAATSLMIGYILTVAVSVSAGGAAIISAIPALQPFLVPMCLFFVALLTIGNLRGVRESGALFSAPTYLFVGTVILLIVLGLADSFLGIRFFEEVSKPEVPVVGTEAIGFLLVLRAFAQGCAAMTGVEAISDGVPAFKAPESKNAATTLVTLITILAIMFLGITYLAIHYNIHPIESHEPGYESVTSQLAHHVVGNSFIYGIFQLATCLILILGANTAFADFPRLTWFLARDKFLPHLFSHQGDRLAFSTGIVTLAMLAAGLIYIFKANVETLVPLYAIGVFTSFTLSQSGMVFRWWRLRTPGWKRSFALNLMGATTTSLVLVILALTQLVNGAWVVVVLVPIFYTLFRAIHHYYDKVKTELDVEGGIKEPLKTAHNTVVVPVSDLNQVTFRTLQYAETLSSDVTAVHVNDNLEAISALRERWDNMRIEIPLVVVETPYRSVIGPLLTYIDMIEKKRSDDTVTVVIPEFVATAWWQNLLHNQTAFRLKAALLQKPGLVVTSVPYHLYKRK